MAVGKRIRGAVYVHSSAIDSLPDRDRARVESASSTSGAKWNVVRVSEDEISLLCYADFDADPFPALRLSTLVRDDRSVVRRDYGHRLNPPVLHRKELLVGPSYPGRVAWSEVTARLLHAGAFERPHLIGTRVSWERRLKGLGLDCNGEPRP